MVIDLQEFLDWYKKSEVNLWDKTRIFREPKLKDRKLSVIDLLEKYCIEWDWDEFYKIITEELTLETQNKLISKVLDELGLA